MDSQHNWDAGKTRRFQRNLLRWYEKHQRALPWRNNPTPYQVWLSEIMLQQTQVKTVIPFYDRFLKRFPDIASLAGAREHEVLALWAGLGYYNRARSLHKAARLIIEKHGEFPREYEEILALPGVGRYTAGAISSIAFSQPRPVVDGNVQRVVTRLKGISKPASAGFFWNQMSEWIPEARSSSFNQAMMELGATICVPLQPRCPQCPVESLCEARRLGIQDRIPPTRNKQAARRICLAILLLQQKGKLLLTSIHKPHFIPGKWGFPCQQILEGESPEDAASMLSEMMFGRKIALVPASKINHSITCYRIAGYAFFGKLDHPRIVHRQTNGFRWVNPRQCRVLLTSSLFRKVAQKLPEVDAAFTQQDKARLQMLFR